MSIRAEAEENLRVIRSLMEKATVYRAVSAPGALVGGLCSVLLSLVALTKSSPMEPTRFVEPWLAVLLITAVANFGLLWRDAVRRGEPFVSPGMRLALRAMIPALLGGALCLCIRAENGFALIASLWVLFYGISLLAASHFAPKSICWLGRAFFAAGAGLLLGSSQISAWARLTHHSGIAHAIMGGTFGLFHLLYAVCAWPRKSEP